MLYLTYKTGFNDGFGAQYQRILGVYALCKEYGLTYVHTPFENIEYQGLAALEKNENDVRFIQECNKRIHIDTINISDIEKLIVVECVNITKANLLTIKSRADATNDNVLLKIQLPYGITDREVEIYSHCNQIFLPVLKPNKKFTIGMHVRRGELFVVDSQRMLPNSFYLNIANVIISILEQMKIDYVVELYTELPSENLTITPQHPGINNRISHNMLIKPEYHQITDFDMLTNLNKYINEDLFDTFDKMVNCDILIASRSSMSASASYVKRGITVYHAFWHNMLKKDIEHNDSQLIPKLKSFISNFS